jgi:hypothetical protein
MSDEASAIQLNFTRPIPLFPLQSVTLMPHALLPLHIFEPRYRKMMGDALDSAGQIAMAVFAGEAWKDDYEGRPPLRPAVCVGQIVQHHKLEDGRYNVLVQGVCRAVITTELSPIESDLPYRTAMLRPIGVGGDEDEGAPLVRRRAELGAMLRATKLAEFKDTPQIIKHIEDVDVPTTAILELVTYRLLPDPELRYRLLAEGDALERAQIITTELTKLAEVVEAASRLSAQSTAKPPKGVSWN